jgi:diguanylate cyclase (GGDEF)-like protein
MTVIDDLLREPKARTPETGLQQLLARDQLVAHFQPIVHLSNGSVYGHEALIRGPAGSSLEYPDALFAAGRQEGLTVELEVRCAMRALRDWGPQGLPGKLLVNMSADALSRAVHDFGLERTLMHFSRCGVQPENVVIELTEHERVPDLDALKRAIAILRRHKVGIALDDFGDGRSSLRLWSEIQPDLVKIDKYFTRNVHAQPEKLQTFRALLQLAETLGSRLVAEGIECADELRVLRDLGISYGQGWLLGRPESAGVAQAPANAREVLACADIAVLPELRRASGSGVLAAHLCSQLPTVSPATTNEQLYRIFSQDERLHALALVDESQVPMGLVDRTQFIARWAKPFFNDLYGRHSCSLFTNHAPLIVDGDTGIEELTSVLTSPDQRYLSEGFIVTRGGRYLGLGTGQQLVRSVTEARIEAARHANPLTFLPGNIPISQHIDRLIASGREFVAAYADLNQFKPFNDHYGYWRGDEMIRLVARAIAQHCDPQRDFVGHVGGDDFVILFQSSDWETRCEEIVTSFNQKALSLFDAEALKAGGIMAEDRHGDMRFHACTTLSIGALRVAPGSITRSEDVASAAATAKREAKHGNHRVYVMAS